MVRRALTIGFAVAAIVLGSEAPAAAAIRRDQSAHSASAQNDLIALINAYRATNGRQHVVSNGPLTAAATWMAGDMAAMSYIGHTSSDGRSPTQRMSAFGYPATSTYTGENLGAGYATAGAVFTGWQASATHNAVLLNPNYGAVGVALVHRPSSTHKWYWVADFGGTGGTVKAVRPPPAIAHRADPAPRESPPQPAEEAVDPEALAREARLAFLDAKRIAHLLAVLQRMGEI